MHVLVIGMVALAVFGTAYADSSSAQRISRPVGAVVTAQDRDGDSRCRRRRCRRARLRMRFGSFCAPSLR